MIFREKYGESNDYIYWRGLLRCRLTLLGQCEKPQMVGRQQIQIPTLFLYKPINYANERMTAAPFKKMRKLALIFITIFAFGACAKAENKSASFPIDLKYYGEVNVGYGTTSKVDGYNTYAGRFIVGTVQGVKINQYFQTGVGLDLIPFTHKWSYTGFRMGMGIYGDFRGTYPLKNDLTPFIDLGFGGFFSLHGLGSGFYCLFGPGIRWKDWAFSCGLNCIGTGPGSSTFFLKTAYIF